MTPEGRHFRYSNTSQVRLSTLTPEGRHYNTSQVRISTPAPEGRHSNTSQVRLSFVIFDIPIQRGDGVGITEPPLRWRSYEGNVTLSGGFIVAPSNNYYMR
jgi:hypothetical protein